uniref:Uncharacterized protein n=1 Tax=Panagrolaimus davidi TaxID=227884 RepID=A0A914Q5M2_9BILA
MDSSKRACATSSNQKRKAQDSMMVTCRRTKFMATYHLQNFSVPDSVIFYIAKNPKTAALYLKMDLYAPDGEWRSGCLPLNLTKYNCKYWITDEIDASARGLVNRNIFSPIIPKIYQCDAYSLRLFHQIISFADLSLLISSAELIKFVNVGGGHVPDVPKAVAALEVSLEDIVAVAIKAYQISVNKPTIAPKTMKALTKLPNFTKLDNFTLNNVSEVFDIDEFYGYMKKNQHTKLFLTFDEQISDVFKNRLETIIDEILETKHFNYKPPFINFTGLHFQKYIKLCQIYFPH